MHTRSIGRPSDVTDGSGEPTPDLRRRGPRRALVVLSWLVMGAVMVGLTAVAVVRVFGEPGDEPGQATTVRDVADQSVLVADGLDLDGGIALLCEDPMDLYRMTVEATLIRWEADGGGVMPAITAEVSDVSDGSTGSFVIRIARAVGTDDEASQSFRVFVDSVGGRSCVTGVGRPDSERQTTRFSGNGYSGVTSPAPAPR